MTESWKSVGNYYCDYCKAFIRNDAFNKRNHESSDRHQNALKRQVRNLHKKHEIEKRDVARTNRELLKMGGKLAPTAKQSGDAAVAVPKATVLPKKINVGAKQKKEPANILEDAEVYRQALAAQAIPGQWTVETTVSPAVEIQEEVKAEDEIEKAIEPSKAIEVSQTAQALKRVREGHDDEMLGFKVAVMETPNSEAIARPAGPAVAFKKRKVKEKPIKPR